MTILFADASAQDDDDDDDEEEEEEEEEEINKFPSNLLHVN